jgi:hypothetical protein
LDYFLAAPFLGSNGDKGDATLSPVNESAQPSGLANPADSTWLMLSALGMNAGQ